MPGYRQTDLPVTQTLRDLLAALPLGQEERDRLTFLDFVLQGHPVIADFRHSINSLTVASELAMRLHRSATSCFPTAGTPRRPDPEDPHPRRGRQTQGLRAHRRMENSTARSGG